MVAGEIARSVESVCGFHQLGGAGSINKLTRERRDFPVMNGRIRRENIYMSDMFPAQWSTYRSARATNKNINDSKMFKM